MALAARITSLTATERSVSHPSIILRHNPAKPSLDHLAPVAEYEAVCEEGDARMAAMYADPDFISRLPPGFRSSQPQNAETRGGGGRRAEGDALEARWDAPPGRE